MGCMAISWTLFGSFRFASVARDMRSTCSKIEADVSCSLVLFAGGGPEEVRERRKTEVTMIDIIDGTNIFLLKR